MIISDPDITPGKCRETLKYIYTTITSQYLIFRKNNKVMNTTPYGIYLSEQILLCHMHTKLAQLRAKKLPPLQSYLHTVNLDTYVNATMPTIFDTHI